MSGLDWVLFALYLAVGVMVALVVHEYAHAFVAVRLGDATPKQQGRLTLNPQPHLDRFGSLFLPAILLLPVLFGRLTFPIFAYARPQPLNPWTLRRDRDGILVTLAGPAANLVLAMIYGAVIRATSPSGQLALILVALLHTTVVMLVLHIVPLPGLDGSRILARILPPRAQEVYTNLEQYLALFVLVIFFIFAGPIFSFVEAVGNGVCRLVAGTECALP